MSLFRVLVLLASLTALFNISPSLAQTTPPAPITATPPATSVVAATRPKVALVLSGGGARGFAHIGVLRTLEKMHVPIDIVVGTSMGAVVGGAYAAGRSADELEQIVKETNWDSVLADRPARYDLDYRRKEEDVILPSRIEFAITKSGVYLPPAAAGNAALEHALTRLLPEGMRDQPVDQLALPFRSVASDLVDGELVELNDTPLLLSMRASLAVPGVFAPVRVKHRLVVDGGLVANLPVELARSMGADVIIAVNVGTPLAKENELNSAIDVSKQMLQILTEQNVQRSIRQLGKNDVLIAPELDGISFLDFAQYDRAVKSGEEATQKLEKRLRSLRVADADYAAYQFRRTIGTLAAANPATSLPLAKIEVQGSKHINPKALIAQTGLQTGQVASEEQIRKATARLYGRGDLDNVETIITDTDSGERNVLIKPTESNSSRNRLRVGLELASDFADDNRFSLTMMHVASSLNSYGAELRTVARIGSQRALGFQLWQPLGTASPWYFSPSLAYNSGSIDLFSNGRKTLRVGARGTSGNLMLGRQLSNWGSIEAGVTRSYGQITTLLPADPNNAEYRFYDSTQFVRFGIDTLDSVAFPTRGSLVGAIWEHSPSKTSGEPSQAQSTLQALSAFQYGDWAGHVNLEWARSQRGDAPNALGGFLRLSGTPQNSLNGNATVLGRIVVARKIGALPSTVGGAIRLGFSAELGGAYGRDTPFSFGDLKQAASAHLSIDTRFGPLFFGVGATRAGGSSLYLFLGPTW